jgi:predicted lipid-binding transport protein (Tim44 family)
VSVSDGDAHEGVAGNVPGCVQVSGDCNNVTNAEALTDGDRVVDLVLAALQQAQSAWTRGADTRALRRALLGVLQLLDETE